MKGVFYCLLSFIDFFHLSVGYVIGPGDFFLFFFSGKILKICLRSVLVFRGLTVGFFLSSPLFIC